MAKPRLGDNGWVSSKTNKEKGQVMGKHLTLDQRIAIQIGLERGQSINAIARAIGKSPRTVAREIRQHREKRDEKRYGRVNNRCVLRDRCPGWLQCPGKGGCTSYREEVCPKVVSAPYVCNGCDKMNKCVLTRHIYSAKRADAAYRATLRECREGANIEDAELQWLDGIVSPGVLRGQSVHHAFQAQRLRLPVSERTVYRYFKAGNMLTARRGDLRRACRLKPRKGKRKEHKLDTKCRENRTYADYAAYMEGHPPASVVQMDTVIGRIGGKCLLTLHFVRPCFQIARLLPDKTAKSVMDALKEVAALIGPAAFARLLEVILTDNGTEFSDPLKIERDEQGRVLSHVFYCDPYNTNQKSQCERNHEYIRMVLPKGTSFDDLTQDDVDTMMSHINSYARPGLGDLRPVDEFDKLFGDKIRLKLGIRKVDAGQITLRPELLKKRDARP